MPVVVPKFKDRRPVYQAASEVMERCCDVAFDLAHINDLMMLVRDDVAMIGRGVAWCRYESGKGRQEERLSYDHEKVCIDFKNRRDFLHSIARNWREVTWVAAASYLTRSRRASGSRNTAATPIRRPSTGRQGQPRRSAAPTTRERAKFWEIWDKDRARVVWVAQGCEDILDEDDPHLDLREFLPLPQAGLWHGAARVADPGAGRAAVPGPARRNQHAHRRAFTRLSDALQAKGFYPAGGGEIGRGGGDRDEDATRRAC